MVVRGNFPISRVRSTGYVDAHNSPEIGSREDFLESAGARSTRTSRDRSGDSANACSRRWRDNGPCGDESNPAQPGTGDRAAGSANGE